MIAILCNFSRPLLNLHGAVRSLSAQLAVIEQAGKCDNGAGGGWFCNVWFITTSRMPGLVRSERECMNTCWLDVQVTKKKAAELLQCSQRELASVMLSKW